jgi:hypothetical protein
MHAKIMMMPFLLISHDFFESIFTAIELSKKMITTATPENVHSERMASYRAV